MIDEEKNALISQFVEVSQASPDEAQELLEASEWDLQDALALYYRGNNESESASSGAATGDRPLGGIPLARESSFGSSTSSPQPTSAAPQRPAASASKSKPKKRFATFADLNQDNDDSPMPSGSDDDDKDLFTGGEKSGLAVQNPENMPGAGGAAPSNNNGRLLNEIFRRAAAGPQGGDDEEDDDNESKRQNLFTGSGHTLGGDDVPSREIPAQHEEPSYPKKVVRKLTFWKDGFSIEDGPLYAYDDPNNVGYLESINAGQAPLALLNVEPGQQVDVHISRRLDENYQKPKPAKGGFHGQGQRLGSPVAPSPSATAAEPPQQQQEQRDDEQPAPNKIKNPDGEGDVVVMLRMANGQAVKRRVRSEDSVGALYDIVREYYTPPHNLQFALQTTFPNRELKDLGQTIAAAGIANSVVVQKIL